MHSRDSRAQFLKYLLGGRVVMPARVLLVFAIAVGICQTWKPSNEASITTDRVLSKLSCPSFFRLLSCFHRTLQRGTFTFELSQDMKMLSDRFEKKSRVHSLV